MTKTSIHKQPDLSVSRPNRNQDFQILDLGVLDFTSILSLTQAFLDRGHAVGRTEVLPMDPFVRRSGQFDGGKAVLRSRWLDAGY